MTDALLTGKAAIVVGVETPAGTDAALALAGAGADVACVAATTDATAALAARGVARKAAALGVRAPSQAIDAAIGTGVQVAVKQLVKELGRLDVLVHAADAPLAKPAARISDAEWARLIGANLSGAFFAMRAAAREIAEAGAIIAIVPSPPGAADHAAYDAAKAGVLTLVGGLAVELADRGPRVYALAARGWPHDDDPTLPHDLGPLVVRLAADASVASGLVLRFEQGPDA